MTRLSQTITIGLVQMASGPDFAANLATAEAGVAEAAGRGASVVCLQELFRTPYPCQVEDAARFDWAETVPGPTTEALSAAAQRHGVAVIAPVFERRAPGVHHNSAVIFDATGHQVGLYRKMHIPDDPLYYEKFYFAPGDLGFPSFHAGGTRIGVLICWDQWFPEAARLTALTGAQIIFYPTAIGWHPAEKDAWGARQLDAWRGVQRGHAIANGCFVAAVNRVGHEREDGGDGIEFWGRSFVIGPMGETIAEAGDGQEVLVAECDLTHLEDVRRHWPFLRDRRIDAYDEIRARWIDEDEAPEA